MRIKAAVCGQEVSFTGTPLRAIRMKCLDCSDGNVPEVRECVVDDCPLYSFRMGKSLNKRIISDEQKEIFKKRMLNHRSKMARKTKTSLTS